MYGPAEASRHADGGARTRGGWAPLPSIHPSLPPSLPPAARASPVVHVLRAARGRAAAVTVVSCATDLRRRRPPPRHASPPYPTSSDGPAQHHQQRQQQQHPSICSGQQARVGVPSRASGRRARARPKEYLGPGRRGTASPQRPSQCRPGDVARALLAGRRQQCLLSGREEGCGAAVAERHGDGSAEHGRCRLQRVWLAGHPSTGSQLYLGKPQSAPSNSKLPCWPAPQFCRVCGSQNLEYASQAVETRHGAVVLGEEENRVLSGRQSATTQGSTAARSLASTS
eukprot:scaffold870_cov393-Prasinococcus_capsulatus_cf.AAC.12